MYHIIFRKILMLNVTGKYIKEKNLEFNESDTSINL